MSQLPLATFLIVFGINLLFGFSIQFWVTGSLAVVAGILIVISRSGFPPDYRKETHQSVDHNG